ncbi:hypothetical protein BSKO_07319 [Bryopsis sp. KO-2023]|nr:hypothetical protein BSKO_07319 [Bryopsis sp. KO-2023]
MLNAGRGSGRLARLFLARNWRNVPCAVSGVSDCVQSTGNVDESRYSGFDGDARRTGVTWALPAAKRKKDQTGAAEISSDDFIYQENFKEGPFLSYKEGRLRGLYKKDKRQEIVTLKFQELYGNLRRVFRRHHRRSGLTVIDNLDGNPTPPAWWKGIVKLMEGSSASNPVAGDSSRSNETKKGCSSLRGLYMYGGVGVGKTMLMDLFVVSSPPEFRVHRAHFHDFMLDIHARLRAHSGTADPLCEVANDISKGCRVLALDEFFVTDVADAMVLHRLFKKLWANDLVLICTSNRKPDDLYAGGLQRDLFLPFIDMLKEACDIHNMESVVDYRKLAHHQSGLYFTGNSSIEGLQSVFENMAGNHTLLSNVPLAVQLGRTLHVPKAAGSVCYYTFKQLCGQAVGAADYIALVGGFHSICLEGVPKITGANRAEAYRLVMLIDVLYDHRARLACSAEVSPVELFENIITQADLPPGGISNMDTEIVVDDNLGFAKDRAISRLTEMQSLEYLVEHANRHAPELLLALAEAQTRKDRTGGQSPLRAAV